MQSRNPFFDDLARVASGAATTLGGVREEVENRVRERMERVAADLELVTREEHEAVRGMAQKAREEQEVLAERVEKLEARLAELEAASAPAKTGATRKGKSGGKAGGDGGPGHHDDDADGGDGEG
jgi:hypothetical protein